MDQPIEVAPETTAAFIGRALRGPLDTPVQVNSFAAFCRRFGSIWRRSSLGPAVEQFFAYGGKRLFVIRVANGARGAMICLPAHRGVLVLRALEPGSTELVRAAIDYDRIDASDEQHFNLTVQRISPQTGLVADQEIFTRLTCTPGNRNFVEDALLTSTIIRAQTPLPSARPLPTGDDYAEHAQKGTDGACLTDYDLIGSAPRGTGIFALNEVERFDLLYMPPPDVDRKHGPAAILAAERFCRKRGAMLIMDPPADWHSVQDAVAGMRRSSFASCNVLAYFPRVVLRGDPGAAPRAAGGAIAGMLCKLDRLRGPWEELDQKGFGFRNDVRPAIDIDVDDARRLVKEGLNVITGRIGGHTALCGSVTLARDTQPDRNFFSLTVRRLCLSITTTIQNATRWAVFETGTPRIAARLQSQIHAYLCSLADAGAFADDNFAVICDGMRQTSPLNPERSLTVMLMFRPVGCDDSISLTLHQTTSVCRVATTAFAPASAEVA
jgi:hypothetical protein